MDSAAASKQQEKDSQEQDRQEEVDAELDRARNHARLGARGPVMRVLLHGEPVWRVVRVRSNLDTARRTPCAHRRAISAQVSRDAGRPPAVASRAMETDEPRQTARAAATAADVRIVDGADLDRASLVDLADLFGRVWGRDVAAMGSIVTSEILWACSHVGSPVAAAFEGDRLVGGSVGFGGARDGTVRVHSHLAGVLPEVAGRGIGRALKWHQRAWCLDRGISTVEWTFDPLVRRNAVINLVHLGAKPVAWFDDLYGPMVDERNAGLPTDRLLVRWDLQDARVRQAASGRTAEPRIDGLRRAGADVVLDVGEDGAPVITRTDAARRLARIPADIEAMRASDRDAAAQWADAARQVVGGAIAAGMRVTGITRDGWYVLATVGGVAEMA